MKNRINLSNLEFVKALFNKQTPSYIKLLIVLGVLYFLLPADFLPELIGPAGFIDDALVMMVMGKVSKKLLEANLAQEVSRSGIKDVTPQ